LKAAIAITVLGVLGYRIGFQVCVHASELVGMALVLALRTLQGRAASGFLPLRDYKFYIDTVAPLRVRADSAPHGMRVS